ncbi:GNAT family N-acetyltransferase [Flavobacterium amniphilum]|uniref:GNAT family N-acetyltransferase n=1 Tax=Flavobacterium amniphilum TaxID=1834035 RepID=UPI002029E1B2|nr:GNAT family N-acetyltransferase [Flavobacterium amniphilum]MCL9804958.1 GNAT family N-acetyltransferase [Flavobacterium amniphilum]
MTNPNATPFPTLTTDRLILRQLSESDAGAIFILRSDAAINKYLNRPLSNTLDDALQFIRKIRENSTLNYWAITQKGDEKLIGTICLFGFSEEVKKGEIGYELLHEYQGKGFVTEATKEVITYAFQTLKLESIEAFTHKDNGSSSKVLENLNFKLTGVDEENSDLLVYTLSK